MIHHPLVSIIVITYNSSKYVIETLESAKNQTYQNIELIISDDGSTDKTIELCSKWLEKNKNRFKRSKMVTVIKNSGIAPNCNRGVNESKGEWIKTIAGDDILSPDVISNYIKFIFNSKKPIHFVYSNVITFFVKDNKKIFSSPKRINELEINDVNTTVERQLNILLYENIVWASTWMFTKTLYDDINGFDEEYPFLDDRPFLINLSKRGYKIHYFDVIGAFYRKHAESVQITHKILSNHNVDSYRYLLSELGPLLNKKEYQYLLAKYDSLKFLSERFKNKKSILSKILFYMLFYTKLFIYQMKSLT